MTKIYLVCSRVTIGDRLLNSVDSTVFTNHKLAKAYCTYWNMKAKKWDKELGKWEYFIITKNICNIDYSDDVIKMEMEELPY